MSAEFDFLTPSDKPALIALSSADLQEAAKTALEQLGYKVHVALNHGEFVHKFAQVPYHVVLLEEAFSSVTAEENESLLTLQRLPMNLRRHSVVLLLGYNLSTFNPLQAFQHGVHAVVNPTEAFLLSQLIQKALSDNDLFLHTFREMQKIHA
jgi:PleD family two-component response regulator